MSTLYDLTGEYKDFLDKMESGEIPEEAINDTLESIEGEFTDKIDACACIIKELNSAASSIKEEKTRLAERQAIKEHQRDRLKDYIRQSMSAVGKKKIETARNCVSIGSPVASPCITDINALRTCDSVWKPYDYGKESNIDKAKLKSLLQSGESIAGAELVNGAPRLTIK